MGQRLNVMLEQDQPEAEPNYSKPGDTATYGIKPDESPVDLKAKYDEIDQYMQHLNKQRKKLVADKLNLQNSRGSSPAENGYSWKHMLIVALITFFVVYMPKFLRS